MPTFGSDIEEWHSPYDQEDPYFESLMDNFLSASGDVCKSMLPAKNTIYKERSHQQQSIDYAVSALKHYNNNENNKVKYLLLSFHIRKHLLACSWFTVKKMPYIGSVSLLRSYVEVKLGLQHFIVWVLWFI